MTSRLPAQLYPDVFAAAPVALIVFDADLIMLDANPAYLAAVSLTLDDIVGRYVFDVFPDSPLPAGADQAASLQGIMRAAIDTQRTQVVEALRYDIRRPDGEFDTFYWNVTEVPIVVDGRTQLVLHYTEDVTSLVVAQQAQGLADAENERLQEQIRLAQADLLVRAHQLEELNGRLRAASEHDRTIAQALQAAMLTTLPDVTGVTLAARYRTAAVDDRVGGDWYDAIELRDGLLTVMIGDVVGHDINAAADMGQLRSMLRAFSWASEEPPSVIMNQLDRAARDLQLATTATAVLVNVERAPDGSPHTLRWTNAGHPPPVLLTADGRARLLEADGGGDLMLGVVADIGRRDHRVDIGPGDTLLLYTDGLVETRNSSIDDRLIELLASVARHARADPGALVDAVLADLVGDQHEDDVAVLVVRADPVLSGVAGSAAVRSAVVGADGDHGHVVDEFGGR